MGVFFVFLEMFGWKMSCKYGVFLRGGGGGLFDKMVILWYIFSVYIL